MECDAYMRPKTAEVEALRKVCSKLDICFEAGSHAVKHSVCVLSDVHCH